MAKPRVPEPTVTAPPQMGVAVVSASPTSSPPVLPQPMVADATMTPHKVAREYALAAAKICESPSLMSTSAASARRLLKAALALLDG